MMTIIRVAVLAVVGVAVVGALGCRPSDVLSVPPPIGSIGSTTLQNAAGAEAELAGATGQLFQAIAGSTNLLQMSGWMTDEFGMHDNYTFSNYENIDARRTSVVGLPNFSEGGDNPLIQLLGSRSALLLAIAGLQQYEADTGRSKIGEAYALVGYAELLMAEDYCAGVPLSYSVPGGGFQYGRPLTTDSLLGTAQAHFREALANANGNDTVVALASVGLGRASLDRGQFAPAASAVASVPTTFVYNTVGATTYSAGFINLYGQQQKPGGSGCGQMQMSDREGGNGLNFISAGDPRLVIDSTSYVLCDGGTWYYPAKFGNPSVYVPLATGVEAKLIIAEAALHAGDVASAVSDLNAVRAAAPNTYLQLASPVPAMTTAAVDSLHPTQPQAVDILFRERAFWLYGMGNRLGDLRRLSRQYGRDPSTVWPSGPYANASNPNGPPGLPPTYGADVSFTLPTPLTAVSTNPYVNGCVSPPSTP